MIHDKLIYNIYAPKLLDNGRVVRASEVVQDMKRDYGVDILYNKAWREGIC